MNKTSEIDTGKDKLKVTCIERRYKVVGPRVSYLVSAKKELDEDITEKLLHEDMELKTFLTYYEITNIMLPVVERQQHIETITDKTSQRIISSSTAARREIFDFLNLPEEFIIRDYIKALEENGIKITNTAMPYDDLNWLRKQGKVIKLEKKNNKSLYKRLKKDEAHDIRSEMETNRTIKSLKEGHKVLMGTFKD